MLTGLLRLFSKLPLAWLHRFGAVLGWLTYRASPSYAKRLRSNLHASGVWRDPAHFDKLLRRSILEAGRASAELPAIWFRPQHESAGWVREVHGWDIVEAAQGRGCGLILLLVIAAVFLLLQRGFLLSGFFRLLRALLMALL